MIPRRQFKPAAVAAAVALSGCVAARPVPSSEPPLPALPVEQLAPPPFPVEPELFPTVPELQGHGQGPPITLSAPSVDVRALIPAITETMGMSVVLAPDVQGRLTIQLEDVPALVALRMVLDAAGVGVVGTAPREPTWEPVVFYSLPVDITEASIELIQSRFGVSRIAAETAVSDRF